MRITIFYYKSLKVLKQHVKLSLGHFNFSVFSCHRPVFLYKIQESQSILVECLIFDTSSSGIVPVQPVICTAHVRRIRFEAYCGHHEHATRPWRENW